MVNQNLRIFQCHLGYDVECNEVSVI